MSFAAANCSETRNSMKNNAYIQVEHLKKYYHSGDTVVKAVDDVSFSVSEGEFVVLLGFSGSGKSTLMSLLASLLRADEGHIFVGGRDITQLKTTQQNLYRRNETSVIFQSYNLLSDLTAYENVMLGSSLSSHPFPATEALEIVNMHHRKNHYISQLSGGEQQRVSIARAIAKNCRLILCDEPTGALDTENSQTILKLMRETAIRYGKTVFMITHNTMFGECADHILEMRNGKLIRDEYNPAVKSIEELEW